MDLNDRSKYQGYFYSAGMISAGVKDWCLQKNVHIPDCLELIYCISGEEEIRVNGKTYSFLPGMVRVFPPSTQVEEDVWIRTLKPSEFIDVGFITKNPFVTESVVIDAAHDSKIRDLFMKLANLHKKRKMDKFFFEGSSVLFLLLHELRRIMDSDNIVPEELDEKLEPAIKYILNHYNEKDFVLQELPRLCDMKKDQFYNMFWQRYNMTPSAYVTNLRMQLALELLHRGDLPISDIAERVGYESVAYFSRVFKKQFGMPPSKYI